VKAGDLLATPTLHWRSIVENDDLLANFLGDFQKIVAGGFFPYSESPYPVSAAIYVALRWHLRFDQPDSWGQENLNSLYRAFFWRNALTNRYDQGFLTQLGKDIQQLKIVLKKRADFKSGNDWVLFAEQTLQKHMGKVLPTKDQLIEQVSEGRQTGALQKALVLPMIAGARQDFLDPDVKLGFPGGEPVELHYIYPRTWCNSNKAGELANLLNKELAGKNWVESTANLMPLSRKSNNLWKFKTPWQALQERGAEYAVVREAAGQAFIDEEAFTYLSEGPREIEHFWKRRANLLAQDLLDRTTITL
jgi:hypothetical protein